MNKKSVQPQSKVLFLTRKLQYYRLLHDQYSEVDVSDNSSLGEDSRAV